MHHIFLTFAENITLQLLSRDIMNLWTRYNDPMGSLNLKSIKSPLSQCDYTSVSFEHHLTIIALIINTVLKINWKYKWHITKLFLSYWSKIYCMLLSITRQLLTKLQCNIWVLSHNFIGMLLLIFQIQCWELWGDANNMRKFGLRYISYLTSKSHK